jgi:hypothetical protein
MKECKMTWYSALHNEMIVRDGTSPVHTTQKVAHYMERTLVLRTWRVKWG